MTTDPVIRFGRIRPTGSGWVLLVLASLPLTGLLRSAAVGTPTTAAIIIALLVVAAVGIVVPVIVIRRVRLHVDTATDAVAGERVDVVIRTSGVNGDIQLRLHGPIGDWWRVQAGSTATVEHRMQHRGVVEHLTIEVRSTVPLGVFDARAVLHIPLPHPVHVAPTALAVGWRAGTIDDAGTLAPIRSRRIGGEVTRTVRDYTPGDPARLVHWPTSARTGDLVVRELEPPEPIGQVVVVDLGGLGDRTETAASYAMGAGLAVLGAGGRLVFCTATVDGPHTIEVRTAREAGRVLAAAIDGPVGAAPEGWPIVEIGR